MSDSRHHGPPPPTGPGSAGATGIRRPSERVRLFGYSAYDFANSAFATTILSVLFNQYYARIVAGGEEGVVILGARTHGATLYAWLVSLSMGLIVLAGPFLGALADRRGGRIRYLAVFGIPGALLTLLLGTVGPGEWLSGGILFILAYLAFAASSIFYNALLPEVGPLERIGYISGVAWGAGYVGGALLLILNLLMLQRPDLLGFPEGALTIQHCFMSVGVWWLLFSLPTFWVFRYERRLPPLQDRAQTGATVPAKDVRPSVMESARESVRQVFATARSLRRTPHLLRFLVAYLIYNDGVQTVVAMASIFGAQELGMPESELILFFLMIQFLAFLGSLALGWLADRVSHRVALMISVTVWATMSAWGFAVGVFGNARIEYWILGGIAGLFLGGIQTCSRSQVAKWIPEHRESEFFGFFAIMTRMAAVVGPLVYGSIVAVTSSLRLAILSVMLFFIIGGAILRTVRFEAATEEKARLARVHPE